MLRIIEIILCIIILTACGTVQTDNDTLSLERLVIQDVEVEIFEYINQLDEAGYFMINTEDKQYLLLSGSPIINGTEAKYFENIEIKANNNVAEIYFDEFYTSDYDDEHLINNQILFLVEIPDEQDSLLLYRNNLAIPFDSIIVL